MIVKIGTNCLFKGDKIDEELIARKAQEIESVDGVLVASGAIKLGKMAEGETRKNEELSDVEIQGYASVGQRMLMDLWCKYLQRGAQVLVTSADDNVRRLIPAQ